MRRPISGYAAWFVLDGLFPAGRTTDALELTRQLWGHMLRYGATTAWDQVEVERNGIERRTTHALSHCHGWSASPAYHLPGYDVIRVRPETFGWDRVQLTPALGDLEWAHCVVPMPLGDLRIDLHAPGRAAELDIPDQMIVLCGGRRLNAGRHVGHR